MNSSILPEERNSSVTPGEPSTTGGSFLQQIRSFGKRETVAAKTTLNYLEDFHETL